MNDYVRFPPHTRGEGEALRLWNEHLAKGTYAHTVQEKDWARRVPFLQSKGYRLRPRYLPGWSPSWAGTNINPYYVEDAMLLPFLNVIDAVRISDGRRVGIKKLRDKNSMANEIAITSFLSSGERRDDPKNHCIPLIEVLHDPLEPQIAFLVEPWVTSIDQPPFDTLGDIVDFITQTLEGIAFMHRNGVAHRDCAEANIKMDSTRLYDVPTHPARSDATTDLISWPRARPRTEAGVRYYFIDFGISSKFEPGETNRLVTGRDGRDKDVPELSHSVPYDPFKVDIFMLGNLYKEHFLDEYRGLWSLEPLVAAMTQTDPSARPSADEALAMIRSLAARTNGISLRWGLQEKTEPLPMILLWNAISTFKELLFYLRRIVAWIY